MNRESRGVQGTTAAPMPETWWFTAFSQVMSRVGIRSAEGDDATLDDRLTELDP
jgi:hypothetical protein